MIKFSFHEDLSLRDQKIEMKQLVAKEFAEQKRLLEKEAEFWGHITTLNMKPALVMPYLVPLGEKEIKEFKDTQ